MNTTNRLEKRLPLAHRLLAVLTASCVATVCADFSAHAAPRPRPPKQERNNIKVRLKDGQLVGTGVRRPTHEEWDWGETNMKRVKKVRVNSVALARINDARAKKGLAPLDESEVDTAPAGQEIVAIGQGPVAEALESSVPAVLPSSVDNSTLKYFPPIRSQGSLGSCAQFSSVYYTLTHMTALARDWDAKSGGDTRRFSPKWTYNVLNGGQNQGTWHYDAYAIAQRHGLATWADFPYDSDYRAWSLNPSTWVSALSMRADQTGKVAALATESGLAQLKQLLLNGYVLNYATYINSWVWSTTKNDPFTANDDALVGKRIVTAVNGTNGGHAMTIVGYNDDLWVDVNANGVVEANEKGALRIANSWDTGWNEAGYAWIAYDALRKRNPAATREGIFWYDEATWVTARASYTPKLIAEFSVRHLARNQLRINLGIGATGTATPASTWYTNRILSYVGGAYAFNGTMTEVPGTFYLDFSDLLTGVTGARRFFLGVSDSSAGAPVTFENFNLIDLTHSRTVSYGGAAQLIDASSRYAGIDYDYTSGDVPLVPPTAQANVAPASGPSPLNVTLDGSSSSDSDGTIVAYRWAFGDGTTATGASAQHTYTAPGTYSAVLTVTDDSGAESSVSKVITVTDPNAVYAPSGVSASVSNRVVTVSWSDNSDNETSFEIQRAVKAKGGSVVYVTVGTVPANARSFSESVGSGAYYYRVRAVNATSGSSSPYSLAVGVRVR